MTRRKRLPGISCPGCSWRFDAAASVREPERRQVSRRELARHLLAEHTTYHPPALRGSR